MIRGKTHFAFLFLFVAASGVSAEAQDGRREQATSRTPSRAASAGRQRDRARSTVLGDNRTNRVASMSASKRDRVLAALPQIVSFRDDRSDRFLVDLDVVRTGHPY
jgi:hypothetical protein